MSRAERAKGKRGELEVAARLRAHGFEARRDGRLDDDLVHDVAGVFFEVKRRETLAVPAWWRETVEAAGELEPVLAFRSSREDWRAVVRLDHLLRLYALVREAPNLPDAMFDPASPWWCDPWEKVVTDKTTTTIERG